MLVVVSPEPEASELNEARISDGGGTLVVMVLRDDDDVDVVVVVVISGGFELLLEFGAVGIATADGNDDDP